jgi:phosphopantothenate-cysteine ligase/phosphopantothenoylcysteine decarboxylase/phosphopantothenate--cysteine ligase
VRTYRTFDDLDSALEEEIGGHSFDVVIHAAAVSDYRAAGIFSLAPGTSFDPTQFIWVVPDNRPHLVDAAAGKVKSSHAELWLRLVPTPKLVDKIRPIWGFTGVLVKFKLEVGLSEVELQEVAERARIHSGADVMVANTLEGMHDWALVGPASLDFQPESSQRVDGQPGAYQKVTRSQLADHLLDAVETVAHSRSTFAKTSPRQGHEGE